MTRTNRTVERVLLCFALVFTGLLIHFNAVGQQEPAPAEAEPVTPVGEQLHTAESNIAAALLRPASVEFQEVALTDAIQFLSKQHEIPIVLDTRALEGIGIGTDTPITLRLKDIPLGSALRLMLDYLDLTFVVREEVLLITTWEEAEVQMVTHVYHVPDLMQTPEEHFDYDSMLELITSTVAPTSWDEVGGPGSITPFDGSLIVSQTGEVHGELQRLLTLMRQAKVAMKEHPEQAFRQRWEVSNSSHTNTKRIEAALEAPTPPLEFIEAPLSDAMDYISTKAEIPVLLHQRALDTVGIGSDTPVTSNLSGISLRSALKLILKELELAAIIRHDVLLITTVEVAEAQTTTALFLVRDLISQPGIRGSGVDDLILVITTSVSPQTWDHVGGMGSVMVYDPLDALVVSQTEERLAEVEALLDRLRRIRQAHEPWSAEKWARQREEYERTVQFHQLHIMTDAEGEPIAEAEVVLKQLKQLLPKEIYERADMKATADSISLFLNPQDLRQLDRAIERGQLPVYRNSGYGLGGFHGKGFSGGVSGFSGGVF